MRHFVGFSKYFAAGIFFAIYWSELASESQDKRKLPDAQNRTGSQTKLKLTT